MLGSHYHRTLHRPFSRISALTGHRRSLSAVLLPALLLGGCRLLEEADNRFLTDEQFQELVLDISGPGGYFDTDNLISNEQPYQHLVPAIRRTITPGAAYLGVGPEQNFTYLAHTRPRVAFIVDIRRDNRLLHLYFKELFERAEGRIQFLSMLLSRPAPADLLAAHMSAAELVERFQAISPDRRLSETTVATVFESLLRRFPELIGEGDYEFLAQVAGSFRQEGLQLRFRSHGRPPRFFYPTLGELLMETDRDGIEQGYLSSEGLYSGVRRLQLENRIIPVVGDLAGERALPRIGAFLTRREIPLGLFYVSNVEFYLCMNGGFPNFVHNVQLLPLNEQSLIFRMVFRHGQGHPEGDPASFVTPIIQSANVFVRNNVDRPQSYFELVTRDYIPVFSGGSGVGLR